MEEGFFYISVIAICYFSFVVGFLEHCGGTLPANASIVRPALFWRVTSVSAAILGICVVNSIWSKSERIDSDEDLQLPLYSEKGPMNSQAPQISRASQFIKDSQASLTQWIKDYGHGVALATRHVCLVIVVPVAIFLPTAVYNKAQYVRFPVSLVTWYHISEGVRRRRLTSLHHVSFICAMYCAPAATNFTLSGWLTLYAWSVGGLLVVLSVAVGEFLSDKETSTSDDSSEKSPPDDIIAWVRGCGRTVILCFMLSHLILSIALALFMNASLQDVQFTDTVPFWPALAILVVICLVSALTRAFPTLGIVVSGRSLLFAAAGSALNSIDAVFKLFVNVNDPATPDDTFYGFSGVAILYYGFAISACVLISVFLESDETGDVESTEMRELAKARAEDTAVKAVLIISLTPSPVLLSLMAFFRGVSPTNGGIVAAWGILGFVCYENVMARCPRVTKVQVEKSTSRLLALCRDPDAELVRSLQNASRVLSEEDDIGDPVEDPSSSDSAEIDPDEVDLDGVHPQILESMRELLDDAASFLLEMARDPHSELVPLANLLVSEINSSALVEMVVLGHEDV